MFDQHWFCGSEQKKFLKKEDVNQILIIGLINFFFRYWPSHHGHPKELFSRNLFNVKDFQLFSEVFESGPNVYVY
jgi:hypothetical protein